MTDCTHPFIERATKLQNGECYSCLRARLEETESERDALDAEAKSISALHDKALEVSEGLRAERETLRAEVARHKERITQLHLRVGEALEEVDALRASLSQAEGRVERLEKALMTIGTIVRTPPQTVAEETVAEIVADALAQEAPVEKETEG